MRYTKIVATIGPASSSDQMLDALIAAGTNVVRLNFSHGTHESHAASIKRIRSAAGRAGRDIAILQDLPGPKIRTGRLEGGQPITLTPGEPLIIATGDEIGGPGRVSTTFAGLAQSVKGGDRLLLSDGLLELRVDGSNGTEIRTTVVEGGKLGERKGINAPGVALPASAVTPKDIEDLKLGLSLGVDLVALSFVQSAADLRKVRMLTSAANSDDTPIVAKLERPEALEHLDEILGVCDAVMVARGDLGLEMPLETVPRAQKDITRRARARGVPVILATQVLESMTVEARPTRAEVSDAANAVDDGVDAIMLSGETAVGTHPARVVATLDAIIQDAESSPGRDMTRPVRAAGSAQDHAQAICDAAVTITEHGAAQAIVAVTRAGSTALRISGLRPRAPILAATDRSEVCRRLAVCWGVRAVGVDMIENANIGEATMHIGRQLVNKGLVPPGSTLVFVSIDDELTRPDSNYLKVQRL
jgi:pyruvate kinase